MEKNKKNKKMSLITYVFLKLLTPKDVLPKCIKVTVSENLSVGNVLIRVNTQDDIQSRRSL